MTRHNKKWFLLGLISGCIGIICIGVAMYLVTPHAFAQVNVNRIPGSTFGLGTADLLSTVIKVIQWALGFLGLAAVIMIIYGGFIWMTAAGNPDKVKKAKRIIVQAVIGLVIILLAWAIVTFIFKTTSDMTGVTPAHCFNHVQDADETGTDCGGSCPACSTGGLPNYFTWTGTETSYTTQGDFATNVYKCSNVQPKFNHVVNSQSLTDAVNAGTITIVDTSTGASFADPAATWQIAGRDIVFRHSVLFNDNTNYQVRIPKALRDTGDLPLSVCNSFIRNCTDEGTYWQWTFMTGTEVDTSLPAVTSTDPVSTGSTYPDQDVTRAPAITVNFSEAIDSTSIYDGANNGHPVAGNFILEQMSGDPSSSPSVVSTVDLNNLQVETRNQGFSIRLANGTMLESFTWYRVRVNNIRDLCNNTMSGEYAWYFETTDQAVGVYGHYPQGTNVCPSARVDVTFGTTMYYDQVTISIDQGDNNPSAPEFTATIRAADINRSANPNYQIAGSNGYIWIPNHTNSDSDPLDNHFTVFEFVPDAGWQVNQPYHVYITTDRVINSNGDRLQYDWTFRTTDAEHCLCAPYVTYIDPNSGPQQSCVTIHGQCFAGTPSLHATVSALVFSDPDGTPGDTPVTPGGSGSDYITTTIPGAFTRGSHARPQVTIQYDQAQYGTATSDNQVTSFYVNSDEQAQGPCLYSVSPTSGYPGSTAVRLTGTRFNQASGTKLVHFNPQPGATQALASWTDTLATVTVAPLAATGNNEVWVENTDGASNHLPFSVSAIPPVTPVVTAHGPICQASCPNAAIDGTISLNVSASMNYGAAGTVRLYRCDTDDCNSGLTLVTAGINFIRNYNASENRTRFSIGHADLDPNAAYRVVLTNAIVSTDGGQLQDNGYTDPNGPALSYSWTFKTKANTDGCTVASVEVDPASKLDAVTGSTIGYTAHARGSANECDARGQEIDPATLTWTWDINDPLNRTPAPATTGNVAPFTNQIAVNAKESTNHQPVNVRATADDNKGHTRTGSGELDIVDCVTDLDCSSNCSVANNHSRCVTTPQNGAHCTPWVNTATSPDPASGPAGQTVTLNGCYFESYQSGRSIVRFGSHVGAFLCQNPWSNQQIVTTFNVDAPYPYGNNTVEVENRFGLRNTTHSYQNGAVYQAIQFLLTDRCNGGAGPLVPSSGVPGLCPPAQTISGVRGQTIADLTGFNLRGADLDPATTSVVYPSDPAGGFIDTYTNIINRVNGSWLTTRISKSAVPDYPEVRSSSSTAGYLHVVVNGCQSNGIDFNLRCSSDSQCPSGGCCRNGMCLTQAQCSTGGIGQLCSIADNPATAETIENPNCNNTGPVVTKSSNYDCISDSGDTSERVPAPPEDANNTFGSLCRVCCDPDLNNDGNTDDPQVSTTGLTCAANQGDCSGGSRGLYCGCTQDSQCGSIGDLGCSDAGTRCCTARPTVTGYTPTGGSQCRNTAVTATFSQAMRASSLNDKTAFIIPNQRWSNGFATPEGTVASALGRYHDNLFIGTDQNHVYSIDAQGQTHDYYFSTYGIGTVYAMAEYDNKLFVGSQNGIFSFGGASGSGYPAGWDRILTVPGVPRSIAVYRDKLYVGTGSGSVFQFDKNDNTVGYNNAIGWSESLAPSKMGTTSVNDLVVYNNILYAATGNDGIVARFDGSNWDAAYDSPSTLLTALEVYNNTLYVGSDTGAGYAFDGANWQTFSVPRHVTDMRVYRDRLYVSLDDGSIMLYDGSSWVTDRQAGGTITALMSFNNYLYAGSDNAAMVYRTLIVPARVTASSSGVAIEPSISLDANATYRVILRGDDNVNDTNHVGVLNASGVGLYFAAASPNAIDYTRDGVTESFTWTFSTGTVVCSLARVDVSVNNTITNRDVFTCAEQDACAGDSQSGISGNQHDYVAHAYDQFNNQLSILLSSAWTWTETDGGDVISVGDMSPATGSGRIVTANRKNGSAMITVKASAYNATKSANVRVNVNVCEKPWPDLYNGDSFPFEDTVAGNHIDTGAIQHTYTNFSVSYCRDDGNLPLLNPSDQVIVKENTPHSADQNELIKEFFFLRNNSDDAIGIRVMENERGISPTAWYREQFGPAAQEPQTLTVDGYPAVRAGRTVYVAATNVTDSLYSTIYLISYNEGASQETIDIYNRLLASWQFNVNIIDQKDALMRDMKRWNDLNDIYAKLLDYKEKNGHFPLLAGGSYLAGMSTSKWPSWQETLGAAVGGNLPTDPLNDFSPLDGALCSTGFDQTTCWSQSNNHFEAPVDSHLYQYVVGTDGTIANLYTKMEYTGMGNWIVQHPVTENPCDGQHSFCTGVYNFQFNMSGTTRDHDGPELDSIIPIQGSPLVGGSVPVEVQAHDTPSGISRVEFWINGTRRYTDDTNDGWTWTWDTRPFPDGSINLEVRLYDNVGDRTVELIPYTINNVGGADTTAPFIQILAPTNDGRVSADVNVQIVSSDNRGLATVQYRILDSTNNPVANTGLVRNAGANESLTIADIWHTMRDNDNNGVWDEPIIPNGRYTIEATAYDTALPKNHTQVTIGVNLDNTDVVPPTISNVSVEGSGTCSNMSSCTIGGAACSDNSECRPTSDVRITVTASDAQTSVDRVVFSVDNTDRYIARSPDNSGNWVWQWHTAQFTNASHRVVASVYDRYNNRAVWEQTYTTFNGSADRVAPVLQFTPFLPGHPTGSTPENYATQVGPFTITTHGSDNLGVTHVDFYFDYVLRQTLLVGTQHGNNLNYDYDLLIDQNFINSLSRGCHTYSTRAYDSANNVGSTEVRYIGIDAPCSGGQGLGPRVTNVTVTPRSSDGQPITVTAHLVDTDGIQSAVVHMQNPDETDVATITMTLTCNANNTICDATASWDPPNPPPDVVYFIDIVASDRLNQITERENI